MMSERELQEWNDNVIVEKHVTCPHCGRDVVPQGPSRWWRVALPFGYALLAVLTIAAAFSGMLVVIALPVALAVGIGVMVMHEYANDKPTCPNCGEELPHTSLPFIETHTSPT